MKQMDPNNFLTFNSLEKKIHAEAGTIVGTPLIFVDTQVGQHDHKGKLTLKILPKFP